MFEIRIHQLSGELFIKIYVKKLNNTFSEIRNIFNNFNFDKCYKILNNDTIIYTDLYDIHYNEDSYLDNWPLYLDDDIFEIELNTILTIIFCQQDKKIIENIKWYKTNLIDLDNESKDCFDIVKVACIQGGHNLEYASEELQNNKEIVKYAVINNACALRYASEKMKDDFDIVYMACISYNKNNWILKYASTRLQDDYDIVKTYIIHTDFPTIEFISSRLKNNPDIITLYKKKTS